MDAWSFLADPAAAGWYAVLHSWDPHEGTFPSAAKWSGTAWEWTGNSSIVGHAGPFPDEASAKKWADDNDPGY